MFKELTNIIESKRNSKKLFWKTLTLGKDVAWCLINKENQWLWKRRIKKFFEKEPSKFKYNLAICSYFKDDAPYLKEWIEFHRIVGVEKFFLYNHGSSDNYLEVLKPYLEKGIVEIADIICPFPPSKVAHMDCIIKQEYNAKWIAFINVDEFLFSPVTDDLKKVLANYEEYPALGVNWQIFGSSGHVEKPKGLQIESYTKKAKMDYGLNSYVKSIVNPRKVFHFNTSHSFKYTNGFCVNENRKKVGVNISYGSENQNLSRPVSIAKIRINHYLTRSAEEYSWKRSQRRESMLKSSASMPAENFKKYYRQFCNNKSKIYQDKYDDIEDVSILKFAQTLKENLNKNP